jgi:hypothetical protein
VHKKNIGDPETFFKASLLKDDNGVPHFFDKESAHLVIKVFFSSSSGIDLVVVFFSRWIAFLFSSAPAFLLKFGFFFRFRASQIFRTAILQFFFSPVFLGSRKPKYLVQKNFHRSTRAVHSARARPFYF